MDGEWMTQHMLVVLINKGRVFQPSCGFLDIVLCKFTFSDSRGEYVVIVYKLIKLDYEQTMWGQRGFVIR